MQCISLLLVVSVVYITLKEDVSLQQCLCVRMYRDTFAKQYLVLRQTRAMQMERLLKRVLMASLRALHVLCSFDTYHSVRTPLS